MESFYEVLELQENCTQEEIEKAYKKAALRYHPDRNPGDNEAASFFVKIQQAYDALKDPLRRRDYDTSRHFRQPFNQQVNINEVEDLDIRVVCTLNFAETVLGTKKFVKFHRKFPCNDCSGNGFKSFRTCNFCQGTGNVVNLIANFFKFQSLCSHCFGKGQIGVEKCEGCLGLKYKTHDESNLEIVIPKGVQNGMTLQVTGHGHNGRNGRIGNIFINCQVEQDNKYILKGLDIFFNFEVDFSTMLFGGKLEIPTFENELIEIDIPAKTQSLTNFRVKGKGMPSFNNSMLRGDLIATVIAKIPVKEFPQELLPVLKYHGI